MWTVIEIASNRVIAEQIENMLKMEGFLVMLRPLGVPHLGDSASVEVLVLESEAEEAMELLNDNFS